MQNAKRDTSLCLMILIKKVFLKIATIRFSATRKNKAQTLIIRRDHRISVDPNELPNVYVLHHHSNLQTLDMLENMFSISTSANSQRGVADKPS